MDRLNRQAAFAAVVLSFTLAACGGHSGGTETTAADPADTGGGTATIQGVSTPANVSVVTAKNAE